MGFPVGMQLATVAFGIPLTATGKDVVTTVTVKPTARVIWAATGQPLPEFSDSFTAEAGQIGTFQVPFIDQAGFIDSTGATFTDWAYQITAEWRFGNERPITWSKNFKPLVAQTGTIDLDLVPDGAVSIPVTAPTAAVLGFHGRTGLITIQESDLPSRLSEASLNDTYAGLAPAPTGVAATDTANLQAFHNALPANGGVIRLAAGDYAINVNSLVITKPVKITGAGAGYGTGVATEPTVSGGTRMVVNSLTGRALDIQADGCVLEDFAVVNTTTGTPTAGAGIHFTAATHMRMRNVTVSNFWVNVELAGLSGWYWTIADCMILDPVKYGIWLHNMEPTGDWADPTVHGTTLTNYRADRTPDAMLRWESGGGVRFQNNKVNTGPASGGLQGKCAIGLDFAVADDVTTGVFTIGGNSLENCRRAMIKVGFAGPLNTGDVAGIVIVGNEIGFGYETCTGIVVESTAAGFGHVRHIIIDGNQMVNLPNGGIRLAYASGITIGENQFNEVVGAPVVLIGVGSQDIRVATQTIRGTAPITLIQNDEELTNLNPKGPFQNIDHVYSRALPAVNALVAPVLSAPATATTGGTLAAATYYYKATYTNAKGETVGSNEVSQVTTGTTSTVSFTIGAAPTGATGTKIYRATTTAAEVLLDTLATTPTSYTDNGSKTPGAATVPTVNTTSLVTLWKFSHAAYSGGLFTLDIGGGISGVGSLSKRLTRSYYREGGISTLGTVGADVAVGAGALDVQFDVTTVPGEIAVQVKLPTGSTGTDAAARATLTINGTVGKVIRT